MHKRVLVPSRVRRVPQQFSWVDQRLVREHHIARCDADALALYLFLVTVADAQGLSFYGDASIAQLLSWSPARLETAREGLVRAGLIAFEAPLYQVLALEVTAVPPQKHRSLASKSIVPMPQRTKACATRELKSMRQILHLVLEDGT